MVNNSVVKLEDGNDYVVVEKIDQKDKSYIYLTNVKDMEDFCIRKEVQKEDKYYLTGLDNEEEYQEAMKLLIEKNN